MDPENMTDTLNSLMSAGFVESVPFHEQVDLADVPVTSFEMNAAYLQELARRCFLGQKLVASPDDPPMSRSEGSPGP